MQNINYDVTGKRCERFIDAEDCSHKVCLYFFMSHVFVITTAVHQVSTEEDFLLSFDFKVRILRIKSEF